MAGFPFALGFGSVVFFVAVRAFLAVCGRVKFVPRVCSTFGGRVCAIRCCPCHFAGMSITHSGCVSVPVAQSFLRCQLRFRCALQCVLLAVIGLCWTRCNAGWRAVLDVSDKVCLVDSWRYPSGAACQNLTLKPVSKNYHFSQLCRLHFASVQSSDRLQKPMR